MHDDRKEASIGAGRHKIKKLFQALVFWAQGHGEKKLTALLYRQIFKHSCTILIFDVRQVFYVVKILSFINN